MKGYLGDERPRLPEVAYLLGVGYPADRQLKPIRKPNRQPFDEVVHHGYW
jgi:nitroreductase